MTDQKHWSATVPQWFIIYLSLPFTHLLIQCPPIPEQKKIVHLVSTVYKKLQRERELGDKHERFKN